MIAGSQAVGRIASPVSDIDGSHWRCVSNEIAGCLRPIEDHPYPPSAVRVVEHHVSGVERDHAAARTSIPKVDRLGIVNVDELVPQTILRWNAITGIADRSQLTRPVVRKVAESFIEIQNLSEALRVAAFVPSVVPVRLRLRCERRPLG